MNFEKSIFHDFFDQFWWFMIYFGPPRSSDLEAGAVRKIENHRSQSSDGVEKSSAPLGRTGIRCAFDL